uniref:Uncharacterized protein n=1 Tax=Oryza barthii TaxID=65489 RepID=A0A0D3GM79_9ORYZ
MEVRCPARSMAGRRRQCRCSGARPSGSTKRRRGGYDGSWHHDLGPGVTTAHRRKRNRPWRWRRVQIGADEEGIGNGDDVAAAVHRAHSRAPVGTAAFPSIGCTNREVVKARFDRHGEKIIEHELDRNGDSSLVIGGALLLGGRRQKRDREGELELSSSDGDAAGTRWRCVELSRRRSLSRLSLVNLSPVARPTQQDQEAILQVRQDLEGEEDKGKTCPAANYNIFLSVLGQILVFVVSHS